MNSNNNNNNFDAYNSFVSYGNDEIQREQSHDWVDSRLSLYYAQAEEDEVQQEAARVEDELDEAFFALHPQPTLQEARRIAVCQLELEGLTLDEPMELEDSDEDEEDSDEDEEDSDEDSDDDEGMINNCNDVCACIRYFEPMEVDEDQDSALYERKCHLQQAGKFPSKRQKTFDENEVIPMDISDDEDDDESDRDESDHNDHDDDEEEDICQHDINRARQVCYDCIWYLDQEARDARLRRFDNDEDDDEVQPVQVTLAVAVAVEEDPYHDYVFPVFNIDSQFLSPMEVDEVEEVEPRPPIRYQRQTTSWVDEETGETVYNGSSDGSRTSEHDDDDDDDDDNYYQLPALMNISQERYQQNLYEVEVTYGDGENVNNAQDAERFYQLREAVAEYERRYKYEYERRN
jgi:hypothetical protein